MEDQRRERLRKSYQASASTATASKSYVPTHYALNDLTALCLGMAPEEMELDAKHQLDRQKYECSRIVAKRSFRLMSNWEVTTQVSKCGVFSL